MASTVELVPYPAGTSFARLWGELIFCPEERYEYQLFAHLVCYERRTSPLAFEQAVITFNLHLRAYCVPGLLSIYAVNPPAASPKPLESAAFLARLLNCLIQPELRTRQFHIPPGSWQYRSVKDLDFRMCRNDIEAHLLHDLKELNAVLCLFCSRDPTHVGLLPLEEGLATIQSYLNVGKWIEANGTLKWYEGCYLADFNPEEIAREAEVLDVGEDSQQSMALHEEAFAKVMN